MSGALEKREPKLVWARYAAWWPANLSKSWMGMAILFEAPVMAYGDKVAGPAAAGLMVPMNVASASSDSSTSWLFYGDMTTLKS